MAKLPGVNQKAGALVIRLVLRLSATLPPAVFEVADHEASIEDDIETFDPVWVLVIMIIRASA